MKIIGSVQKLCEYFRNSWCIAELFANFGKFWYISEIIDAIQNFLCIRTILGTLLEFSMHFKSTLILEFHDTLQRFSGHFWNPQFWPPRFGQLIKSNSSQDSGQNWPLPFLKHLLQEVFCNFHHNFSIRFILLDCVLDLFFGYSFFCFQMSHQWVRLFPKPFWH